MEVQNLTDQDYEILIAALDAWVTSENEGLLFKSLIGAMLVKDNPDARERMDRELETMKDKADQKKHQKERTATLLKAKLILLQQKLMDGSPANPPIVMKRDFASKD